MLLVALALGALVVFGPHLDGRSYGGFLARKVLCAVRGGCDDGRDELVAAYGSRDAALVRDYAPNIAYEPGEKEIPIEYRQCRTTKCGDAPTDRSQRPSRPDLRKKADAGGATSAAPLRVTSLASRPVWPVDRVRQGRE